MKYRTFAILRNSAVLVLVGVGVFGLARGCGSGRHASLPPSAAPEQSSALPEPPSGGNPRPFSGGTPVTAASSAPDRAPLTDFQREVLDLSRQPTSNGTAAGDSIKWRVKRKPMVVELRCDTGKGSTGWNRLKIDVDGDKQWDEAWDLRPDGAIKRRVSPADDGNYALTYDLSGDAWVRRGH